MTIESRRLKLKPFDFVDNLSEYKDPTHPLHPIAKTDGLIFLITPSISEQTTVNYSSTQLVHTNEEFNTYQNTSSRVITITDIKFPCDTFENSRYALAALHFFRSYTFMDYGQNETSTGRPPSPMWLSGFGDYVFNQVPCLYGGYDFTINNNDMDLIATSNPEDFSNFVQTIQNNSSGSLTTDIENFRNSQSVYKTANWIPTILSFGSIMLRVQHTPNYWKKSFSLTEFKKGNLLNDF